MSLETAQQRGDEAVKGILSAVESLMQRASERLASEVAGLDTDRLGNILATADNVNRIPSIMDRMTSQLFDDTYVRSVTKFVKELDQVSLSVSESLQQFGAPPQVMGAVARKTKAQVASVLLSPQSFRGLLGQINNQLTIGVATGAPITDVVQGVTEAVKTSKIDTQAHAQVSSAPTILQRSQTAAAAQHAGIVFYRFQGRNIDTTRKWCKERAGKVWHIEEIREWGRAAESGEATWDGMVQGTNEHTIMVYLGGWYGSRESCRHVLVPVLPSRVPEEDMMRMREKGLVK